MDAQHFDVGGHELRASRTGHGPPHFLCLHGLVDDLSIWDRVALPLSERGEVIRFDQRGHGTSGSPPGPYRREDLGSDAIALLDTFGIERAVLVGHSMGGIVAMTAALAHPDRVAGLVLIGTASHCSEKIAGWYERIALVGESEGCAGIARTIYGERSKRRVSGDAQGIAHVTRTLKSLYDDPLTPKLSALRCPVLLLVGENDPMGPKASENIARELSERAGVVTTLEVADACGHWVHVENPRLVVAALDRWLADAGLAQGGSSRA